MLIRPSKTNRLRKKHEFDAVFSQGKKIKSKSFLIFVRQSSDNIHKLGIIIPKSIIKQSVKRNLIKRLVRESYRLAYAELKGLELLVLLRSNCTPRGQTWDKRRIRTQIDHLWQQVDLL